MIPCENQAVPFCFEKTSLQILNLYLTKSHLIGILCLPLDEPERGSVLKQFEFLEHTADIIIKGIGDTLEEAIAASAQGLFACITTLDQIDATVEIEFQIESIDRQGLLVAFLSKLIYIHEVDLLVFSEFEISLNDEIKLTAKCSGEKFNDAKHEPGMHVKAVSYHMLEIVDKDKDGNATVQVLIDV
jgi:protein archease